MSYSGISRVIDKIKFGLLSPNEIRKMSATRIITADTYDDDGLPLAAGLMDQKLGTIEPGQKCTTCGNRVGQCLGHFGHIELARPVVHVGFAKLLLKLLRSICPSCSRLLVTEDQFEDFKIRKEQQVRVFENVSDVLIQNIFKLARKTKNCPFCGEERKKITIEKPTTYYEEVGLDQPRRLYPSDIRERLEKMNDADCRLLEINPQATRPEWMILTVLPIPPVCVRPSITLDSGIRSEDDLTHKLVDVIRINARLRENIDAGAPQLIVEDLWELLQYHITTFFNNEVSGIPPARHRSGRALRTLTQRLKGKEGRFRSNLSGKRVDFSARTVISPNPHISINEVGVPEIIAKILTVPNHVTEWNIEDMKQLIINGPDAHPGANYIIRTDNRRIDLRYVKDRAIIADTIQPGYVVERHLRNKDLVLFNRQPSLHRMSIMAHEVRIITGKTFQLALLVCTPYNADFDGDEMNLHVPQSDEARAEAQFLLKVQEHILSPRYGGPIIGGVHDFISLAYIFTRKDSMFDRNTTYQMLEWGNIFRHNPDFRLSDLKPVVTGPEPMFSGKSIFSTLLPKDLNMQLKSNFCRKCEDGCKEEDCDFDGFVNIVNGELISGVLDEKTYGAGKPTTILLRMTKDYGADAARQFLDDSSSMLLYFIMHHALTMGLDEVDITSIMPEITNVMVTANQQCDTFIRAFYENDEETMPCAPGRTYQETLELRIQEVLNIARDEAGKIGSSELGDSAHSVIMTKSGARGNPLNLTQMAACVGPQAVRGKRIHRGFSDRTLPHFKLRDLTARARGFVESSYRKGLDPIEFFFHAMGGREGLVDTAVRTSSSGYMQRRLVNALQDMVVQNDGTVRTSTDNIIQFVYGDDRIDPAKSDHGDAVNVKNIFLKTKTLYKYLDHDTEFRKRKIERLKEDNLYSTEIQKEDDLLENFQPEYDADSKKISPKVKKPTEKKKTIKPKTTSKKKTTKKTASKKKSTKKVPIKKTASKKKSTKKKTTKKTASKKKSTKKKTSKKKTEYTEEFYQNLYNEETGKTAIWRGATTKLYLKWLESKKEELGVK